MHLRLTSPGLRRMCTSAVHRVCGSSGAHWQPRGLGHWAGSDCSGVRACKSASALRLHRPIAVRDLVGQHVRMLSMWDSAGSDRMRSIRIDPRRRAQWMARGLDTRASPGCVWRMWRQSMHSVGVDRWTTLQSCGGCVQGRGRIRSILRTASVLSG